MVATETGPAFFSLAFRVSAFQGVMAARHAEWASGERTEVTSPGSGTEVVESGSSRAELMTGPASDLIEYGEG